MAEEGPRLFNARWKGAEEGTDSLKAGSKEDSPQESLLGSGRATRGLCRRETVDAVSLCTGVGWRRPLPHSLKAHFQLCDPRQVTILPEAKL